MILVLLCRSRRRFHALPADLGGLSRYDDLRRAPRCGGSPPRPPDSSARRTLDGAPTRAVIRGPGNPAALEAARHDRRALSRRAGSGAASIREYGRIEEHLRHPRRPHGRHSAVACPNVDARAVFLSMPLSPPLPSAVQRCLTVFGTAHRSRATRSFHDAVFCALRNR